MRRRVSNYQYIGNLTAVTCKLTLEYRMKDPLAIVYWNGDRERSIGVDNTTRTTPERLEENFSPEGNAWKDIDGKSD